MSFCVNRNSLKFKNLVNELNIHPNQLEMIIHEYINREGAGSDQYPSIDYIKSKMSGGVWSVESKAQLDLYNREYSTPRVISLEALAGELARAKSYFPEEAVNVTTLDDGSYQLNISKPSSIYSEHEAISSNITDRDNRLINLFDKTGENTQKMSQEVPITEVIKMLENGEYAPIIELLKAVPRNKKLLTGITFKLATTDSSNAQFNGRRAYYDATNHTIVVNPYANYRDSSSDSVLMHEIMHAITVDKIVNNPRFRAQFDKIIDTYQKSFFNPKYSKAKLTGDVHYMEEFIADVWSNLETINNLKSIKVNTTNTLWERIKSFFKELFAGSEGTLMQEASTLIDRLLDETTKTTGRGNFYEGETLEEPTFKFYSGAASGSDTVWANEAKALGIETVNFTVQSWDALPQEEKAKYNAEYQEVVKTLGRRVLPESAYSGKLVRRDMMQADIADAIFAIGSIASNGYVNGGTAYATTRGIQRGIPVYLFDQSVNQWKVWNRQLTRFELTSEPMLTPNAATIGTRGITPNGESAIRNILKNSREKAKSLLSPSIKGKSALEKAAEDSQRLVNQYNNLGQDNLFSSTEMHHIAEQLVYFLGDRITDYLVDPQLLLDDVAEIAENSDVKITIPEDAVDKIPNMTRLELVNYIGADNLINIIKEQLFNPSINSNIGANATTFRARNRAFKQANLIKDNIGLILELANDTFIRNEGFAIVFDDYVNKKAVEVTDSESFKDDKEESEAEIAERGESLQEHWQIEFRTQDTMTSMSQIVRQAINNCFELDEDGNEILDSFGLPQRREPRASTQAILRITQGSLNLTDMITKMRASLKENPWMQQIIDRLEDRSGNESDFQSQFYGVFQKHFQTYNIVKFNEKTKKFESFPVNIHPARKDAKDSIRNLFRLGEHPMYSLDGVNTEMFSNFKQWYSELVEAKGKPIDDENEEHIFDLCNAVLRTIGLNLDENVVKSAINSNTLNTIVPAIGQIIKVTENVINSGRKAWNPFEFSKEGISGNVDVLIAPFTDMLEDSTSSAFYESGKMYQSYVIPSYMTTLMNKFKQKGDEFNRFLEEEYGVSEWYRNKGVFDPELADAWRCPWLSLIASDADKKAMFDHKVELAFNKHNYMRTMDDNEYALSLISEFFVEKVSSKSSEARAWYRVPMLSNKPSSEFIQFVRYTGSHYQDTITAGFMKIFNQELSRIQTVEQRAAEGITKSDERYIKNFDSNGKKFNFLTFLNDYLKGGSKENTELGKLLNAKISSGRVNEAQLNALVDSEIRSVMNAKADEIISDWRARGITATATKKIQGFDESNADSMLREFIWNDTFATMNIMEILVTDPAFYKDAEDLQKRFAQIHAPGIRGNKDATDYNGKKVSDGFHRSVTLKDFEGDVVKSNIIDNLLVVFNRKLDEYKRKYPSDEAGYQAQVEYYDSIVDAYENEINAADAQSFISPTAYRKNAFIFGKWNPKKEELYQKIKSGVYTYGDLQTVFGQPLKPFVYGKTSKYIGTKDSAIQTIQMPIQNKNSEYLLLMADAILQGEDTGRPNLLRAIFRVMEESAEANDGAGIDSIQLESAVKSGLCGKVNLTSYLEDEEGETKAYDTLKDAIYTRDNNGELTTDYNTNVVQKLDFDYYCIQQEVPAHFREHKQAHGSQLRYMIISDLEGEDSYGNPNIYNFVDNGEEKKLTPKEFKAEYEATIAENINESFNDLANELGIYPRQGATPEEAVRERNIALSRILQKEILSSPRYGIDLLIACSVDADGNFNIPLGDPIQSKRVEQLINSIIKNRFNKQEIAGGPVVQVTNLGLSRRLNIVFKDKNGKELRRSDHQELSDSKWAEYLEKNQDGVAYYECFAPISSNKLFERFADENGIVDIEEIKRVQPELLEMVGYRIPTEDKYSAAPLRIVGFLPKEAGEGLMLPYEITLITGSDFDVRLY